MFNFKWKKPSEQSTSDKVQLGIHSQLLRDNPAFGQSVEELRAELYESFKSTHLSDPQTRETLFHVANSLDLVVQRLDVLIQRKENENNATVDE